MTTKCCRFLAGLLAFLFVDGRFAAATTNVFLPVSGPSFTSNSPLVFSGATVSNSDVVSRQLVVASLGHAAGGTNGFTFIGTSDGTDHVTCSVIVWDANTGAELQYFASSTSTEFRLFVETALPPRG